MLFSVFINRSAVVLLALIALPVATQQLGVATSECDIPLPVSATGQFEAPPEGVYFRIIGFVTGNPVYSRTSGDPTFSSLNGPERADDQYFSLVKVTGKFENQYRIRGKKSEKYIFSRTSSPTVGHVFGDHADTYVTFVPGTMGFKGMTRIVVPYSNTVLRLPKDTTTLVNQPFSESARPEGDQFFIFEYKDLEVQRIVYDFDSARVVSSRNSELAAAQYFTNLSPFNQTQTYSISATNTRTSTFEYTHGLSISGGIKASVGTRIPGVVGAKAEFSSDLTISGTLKNGQTDVYETTHTFNKPVTTAPNHISAATTIITIGELEVPYTMYLVSKSTRGQTQSRGIWRGTTGWNVRSEIASTPIKSG